MIRVRTRRVIQGSDYSAQEPRLLSQLCGDENMLNAYKEGKDLYCEIASIAMHLSYRECLEHFPKGCPIKKAEDGDWFYAPRKDGKEETILNYKDFSRYLTYQDFDPDDYDYDKLADGETDTYYVGKERRGQAKKILLGIMYGRGEKSIAEQLGCKIEEARAIKDNVYKAYPKIKIFEEISVENVKKRGFVTTLWGRKRRLPDYNLPPFECFYVNEKMEIIPGTVPEGEAEYLINSVRKTRYDAVDDLIEKFATERGILVVDNRSKIADAMRQIINSQVQGSAADMSKMAMIKLNNDEELKKRKVKLIIPVHDEILIETPLRYARYVKGRFEEDMNSAAKPRLTIPTACDVVTAYGWYHEELDLDTELEGLEG